jgi:hypothetical protein
MIHVSEIQGEVPSLTVTIDGKQHHIEARFAEALRDQLIDRLLSHTMRQLGCQPFSRLGVVTQTTCIATWNHQIGSFFNDNRRLMIIILWVKLELHYSLLSNKPFTQTFQNPHIPRRWFETFAAEPGRR